MYMTAIAAPRNPRIKATDREIAIAVLKAMAESDKPLGRFSPRAFYDDDSETVERITELLGDKVPAGISWSYLHRRLMRVCNHLTDYGVIAGSIHSNPDRQYIGEEVRQKEFYWGNAGYAYRICPEKYPHYTPMPGSTREREIDWLLRRAYPDKNL
ncbi:Uncharacterised protein [Pseudomonas luteola]|uniref:Uncharacterized protein n=2 Tax=Pseudomonas luteola TaxID=47886 RepID=A0A2X2CD76_PSELU|nr:Uncharacterised protein [Pseudomonas luteola]